jgi:hypothetical protein
VEEAETGRSQMTETGAGRQGKQTDLSKERAELLPPRTTLSIVEIGRRDFTPANFPVASPESNNSTITTASTPEIANSVMPVVITLMPTFNLVVQNSDSGGVGFAHDPSAGTATVPLAGGGNGRYLGAWLGQLISAWLTAGR